MKSLSKRLDQVSKLVETLRQAEKSGLDGISGLLKSCRLTQWLLVGQVKIGLNPHLLQEVAHLYHRIGEVPEHYRFAQLYTFKELDIASMKRRARLD